jgi:hypothetical protein
MYRTDLPDSHVNAGQRVHVEGIIFSDGAVAVRWVGGISSCSVWASFDDFTTVHGHPEYGTLWEWVDTTADVQSSQMGE